MIGRAAHLAYEISPLFRVPHSLNLFRVGIVTAEPATFRAVASAIVAFSAVSHVRGSRAAPQPRTQVLAHRAARTFVAHHLALPHAAVPVPCWDRLSGERTVLDLVPIEATTPRKATKWSASDEAAQQG